MKSRVKGDFQARFRENVEVKFPRVTRLCDTFELHETQRNRIKKNKQKLNYVNYEKYNYKN